VESSKNQGFRRWGAAKSPPGGGLNRYTRGAPPRTTKGKSEICLDNLNKFGRKMPSRFENILQKGELKKRKETARNIHIATVAHSNKKTGVKGT